MGQGKDNRLYALSLSIRLKADLCAPVSCYLEHGAGAQSVAPAYIRETCMWRASTTGPDETDLQAAMRAIGTLHSGEVRVTITPIGGSPNGGLLLEVSIHLTVLPGSSLPSRLAVASKWPCADCKTLVGHLWGQMIVLDHAVEMAWNQIPLPEG